MDITSQTIDKILSLKQEPTFKVKGVPELEGYEFLPSGEILTPPTIAGNDDRTIKLNSLTGLVDFVKSEKNPNLYLLVHIESPTVVKCLGQLDQKYKTREVPCIAEFENENFEFPFGSGIDQETFILNLLANFEDNSHLQSILGIVSNVEDVNGSELSDDGFKQNITVKSGITYKKVEGIKNPITLTPKKTFREIEQVDEIYILRVQKTSSGLTFKLIAADGGDYSVTAQSRIKQYLSEALKDLKEVTIVG